MKTKRKRKSRPKGLVYTRCAICNKVRSHTIAITKDGPMLRCQTCHAMRTVAQTSFTFAK